MILVDTSVWIDHLRKPEPRLIALLEAGQALTHPFVVGELACGNLKNRVALRPAVLGQYSCGAAALERSACSA